MGKLSEKEALPPFTFYLPSQSGLTLKGKEFAPIIDPILTLLHPEWPKLYGVLAILSAKGLTGNFEQTGNKK